MNGIHDFFRRTKKPKLPEIVKENAQTDGSNEKILFSETSESSDEEDQAK
jgi:hypothetical protein